MAINKSIRQNRLDLLLRKNCAAKIVGDLKRQIIENTSINEIEIMSLEISKILWEKFCSLFKSAPMHKNFKIENQLDNEGLSKILAQLLASKETYSGYMFLSQFKDVGAFRVNTDFFFRNADCILKIDGDSICMLSEDSENGLMIDHYESDCGTGWTYEVSILGKQWVQNFKGTLEIEH